MKALFIVACLLAIAGPVLMIVYRKKRENKVWWAALSVEVLGLFLSVVGFFLSLF